MFPWIGSGFRIVGATSTRSSLSEASCPFDKRRNGMIVGSGAIGIVVESETSLKNRINENYENIIKCKLIDTQYSNSELHLIKNIWKVN